MSCEIVHRYTGTTLYRSNTAADVWSCVGEALSVGASLAGADLMGADLMGADLRGTDLMRADLMRANLMRADLRNADLRNANLKGANLMGANLMGANLGNLHVLQIVGSQHGIVALLSPDDCEVRIGCERHPLAWWLEHYRNVGDVKRYTPAQIAEYERHLAYVEEWAKHVSNCTLIRRGHA